MRKTEVFLFGAIVVLLFALGVVAWQYEDLQLKNTFLEEENWLLKERNHMLKTALENSEAQIEKISTTIDTLRREQSRASKWNKDLGGF